MQAITGLLALAALGAAAPKPQTMTAEVSASAMFVPAPPLASSNPAATSHGPYTGPSPTITGAASTAVLAQSIAPLPPMPQTYILDGKLHNAEPVPYTPHGGLGTNGTEPVYLAKSDFDYQSLALALYQEWIELDLFHNGLAMFSVADFEAAGLTAEDRSLLEFMADQEIGHATLITNMLGPHAPKQCQYNYPYTTVREYVDFCQKLTRFGESGVYGFLNHLDSREVAQLLLQSISTEARQQMIFRQFNGQHPMPVWFEIGLPQSYAWTLLAPYISSCPANNTRLIWQNFPALTILNQPSPARINPDMGTPDSVTGSNPLNSTNVTPDNACVNSTIIGDECSPAITHNKTIPLSYPGRVIHFSWESAGKVVGPNNSYVTASGGLADAPRYALFINQLNTTYVPLVNISGNTGSVVQPDVSVYGTSDPAANGTMFISLTSAMIPVTAFNLTMVLPYTYAGPAIYQAG